jgi:hypothetical protein
LGNKGEKRRSRDWKVWVRERGRSEGAGKQRIGGTKQWSSKEAERTKGQKAKDRMRVGGRAR